MITSRGFRHFKNSSLELSTFSMHPLKTAFAWVCSCMRLFHRYGTDVFVYLNSLGSSNLATACWQLYVEGIIVFDYFEALVLFNLMA